MAPLRAGDLKHRVTIRRAVEVKTATGGYSASWEPVVTVWAEVRGLGGRESVMDKVLQGVSVYRIRIRWRGDVLTTDQLRAEGAAFLGRDLNIRSADDPDGTRDQLVIVADSASTLGS